MKMTTTDKIIMASLKYFFIPLMLTTFVLSFFVVVYLVVKIWTGGL